MRSSWWMGVWLASANKNFFLGGGGGGGGGGKREQTHIIQCVVCS